MSFTSRALALVLLAAPPAAFAATTSHAASDPPATIAPVVDCAALAAVDFASGPGAPARVISASTEALENGEFCVVSGYVAPQTEFVVQLPTSSWTGRYLQQGCGGMCGSVLIAPPAQSAGCAAVQNGELAMSMNNGGHLGASITDAVWAEDNEQLQAEYAEFAQHNVADVSKAIIETFYGQAPTYAYFDGCSNGGRQALIEAQRYPDDFDGILAGAPVIEPALFAAVIEPWIVQSNTADDGTQLIGVEQVQVLHAAVVAACGDPDGLVADPAACEFDPGAVACPDASASGCLTPEQVAAARAFYTGPVDDSGAPLTRGGLPYGSELAWIGWNVAPPADDGAAPIQSTVAYQFASSYLAHFRGADLADVEFTTAFRDSVLAGSAAFDAVDPDLSAYADSGGKIVLYHGWADQAISAYSTIDYYDELVAASGGYAGSQQFSRLYLVPGQSHCFTIGAGAPTVAADLLTPLIEWVESGVAPAGLDFPVAPDQDTALTAVHVDPYEPAAAG